MLFVTFLILITGIACHPDYQALPLRFDAVLQSIRQHEHDEFANLLDEASTFAINSISALPSENQTTQCEHDFQLILEAVAKRDLWALKTIDAWGKPLPSGILKGNTFWIGSYDECLQPLYQTTNKSFLSQPFETQHCTLSSPSSNGSSLPPITLGMCVPSSCDRSSVVALIHTLFRASHITTNNLVCSNDPPNGQKGLTGGAIGTIVVISLLGLLVLVGTAVDIFLTSRVSAEEKVDGSEDEQSHVIEGKGMNILLLTKKRYGSHGTVSFLAEFSALRTLRRIFTMKQKNDPATYLFLNGIRVLSLFWVIIGHAFLFPLSFTSNVLDPLTWTRNVFMQLISSGVLSVDTFFVLSGFLTTVLFVREVEKRGKLSIRLMVLYYVHRYIRLTPAFLLVVFTSIHLTPYFGSGPIYPTQQGFEVPDCRSRYWWTSIVYVGNVVKPDAMCLPIAWYLHNDMQFHWVAPLALVPFALRRKSIAFVIAILFTLVGIGSITGLLIYYPDLQSGLFATVAPVNGRTFFNTVYVTPWCRVSAYFVGVLTGFLVINTGRSYRVSPRIILVGNVLAFVLAVGCFFGIYPDNIMVPGIDRTSFIIYQSLSRTIWSLVIGWIFFSCITNHGGLVNKFLSWPIWAPLARLNYSTYLIHLTVIFITLNNQRLPFYYQPHLVVNLFVTQIFFSYVAAILVSIFFETPFFILEKKLFKRQ